MEPGRASVTAMATALMRADHTRTAPEPLIDDPWGDRLVPAPVRDRFRDNGIAALSGEARARFDAAGPADQVGVLLRMHPSYAAIIIRARYAEDALAAAIGHGVRQYVLVGAGLDSFALRRPAYADGVEVFEVDHPDTQSFKLSRLAECGLPRPAGAHFVPADLGVEGLESALGRSSFDPHQPSFFSWLGVTAYLTREANLRTLRALAACGAPGSELVFDYGDQRAYDSPPTDEAMVRARSRVAELGEPWISGFYPSELGDDLRALGFELVENLATKDLVARYCPHPDDSLTPSAHHHIARARLGHDEPVDRHLVPG